MALYCNFITCGHYALLSLMCWDKLQAGIDGRYLTIALEPECAAIYCSQLSRQQLEIEGDNGKLKYIAAPGSVVMIVDMGGMMIIGYIYDKS